MLKIKDNVDLKELEKFGFELNQTFKYYEYGYDKYDVSIYILILDRVLHCSTPYDYNTDDTDSHLDILYDLIKADLVEKVEE